MLKTVCWRTYGKWNIGPMIKLHFPTWEAEFDQPGKRNVVSHNGAPSVYGYEQMA
jgi:hypothetical protein